MRATVYPPTSELDYGLSYAESVIYNTYGDRASVKQKNKPLNKFGLTENADAGVATTVAEFQGSVVKETFVSTSLIDSIVSDNAADTQTVTIEGHTIDGSGNLTFTVQDATLNGTTEVTLTTPLARATRLYIKKSGTFNSPQASSFTGNIYVYDNTDGISAGVPVTAAATKLFVKAGRSQSRKCATSVSSVDYWIITSVLASVRKGSSGALADVLLEIRDVANGGVWVPLGGELTVSTGSRPAPIYPYYIVPPNHDVRATATSNTANTTVAAEIRGFLALIV